MLWKLPNIVVPPDALFYIGPFPVYNTLILSVVSALIVLGFFGLPCGMRDLFLAPYRT